MDESKEREEGIDMVKDDKLDTYVHNQKRPDHRFGSFSTGNLRGWMEAPDMGVILKESSDWTWDGHHSLARRSRNTPNVLPEVQPSCQYKRAQQNWNTQVSVFVCQQSAKTECHSVNIFIFRAAEIEGSTRTNLKKQLTVGRAHLNSDFQAFRLTGKTPYSRTTSESAGQSHYRNFGNRLREGRTRSSPELRVSDTRALGLNGSYGVGLGDSEVDPRNQHSWRLVMLANRDRL
ncbi:uncharacterized protein F5891DRAFT_1175930 [Suillus fuscotomentosus]|uniref:Uncharacterized protein n=1 Tax=Suillus fuscotomentosus TaxID=1912939 RepID=A0AAD4HEL5_9AGAM|nr:uncharacterized protein F5891DRAFT_1175930 [Suillus fuscotomentosus]KAG1894765.1 hypothetical protein F5891DRAFT_1175930 [Suillus fuscotomentosus]